MHVKKNPCQWAALGCILLALTLLTGLIPHTGAAASESAPTAGLFSWKAATVNKSDGQIFSTMEQVGLHTLYQNFSSKTSRQAHMAAFLEAAMEKGVTVYQLTGDPSWAMDAEGVRLCEAVEEAASYNRRVERKFLALREEDGKAWDTVPRLAGIVFDVEPYTLDAWDEDPGAVMDSFVSGMKHAYALAKENGLEVILCIPWFYDTQGLTKGLRRLVRDCCDSVLVMNYYRGAEIGHIAAEAELAAAHGKGLITAYELQEADGKQIQEANTYYSEGLAAVRENFAALQAAYQGQTVSMALHDYRALEEVLADE